LTEKLHCLEDYFSNWILKILSTPSFDSDRKERCLKKSLLTCINNFLWFMDQPIKKNSIKKQFSCLLRQISLQLENSRNKQTTKLSAEKNLPLKETSVVLFANLVRQLSLV
jgi:hypothetical protein